MARKNVSDDEVITDANKATTGDKRPIEVFVATCLAIVVASVMSFVFGYSFYQEARSQYDLGSLPKPPTKHLNIKDHPWMLVDADQFVWVNRDREPDSPSLVERCGQCHEKRWNGVSGRVSYSKLSWDGDDLKEHFQNPRRRQ